MEKEIFNELDMILEELEKEEKEEEYEADYEMIEIIFDEMFDNEYQNKQYVIAGTLGLWDGKYSVYCDEVFYSLKDAINRTREGNCYVTVKEGKYGKFLVEISHHDGRDYFEIREVTKLGKELVDNWYDGNLFDRKGATKNVKYFKNCV